MRRFAPVGFGSIPWGGEERFGMRQGVGGLAQVKQVLIVGVG